MTPPESESSLPLPNTQQQNIYSSPPAFEPKASFDDMDDEQDFKSGPAGSNVNEDTRPPVIRANSGDTDRPPSAQRANADSNEPVDAEDEEVLDEDVDPAEQIEDFNWQDLYERYHDAMDSATGQEAELMQEWSELMEYFKIWAEAGQSHETDRTFSRLRTRMAYVENSEAKLEKTRQHYINVVKAFESALALLRNAGFQG